MQTFRDRNGKDWLIELTLTTATRLKTDAGIDVYAFRSGGVDGIGDLYALPDDSIKMFAALSVLTHEAREKLAPSVTPEQFGNGLSGDSLKGAGEALVRAVIDFFPDPDYREILTQVMGKSAEVRMKILADAAAQAKAIDPGSILSTLKNSPGNGPASSESIPAGSASASSK